MRTLIYQLVVRVPDETVEPDLAKAIQDDIVDAHEAIEAATVVFLEDRTDPPAE